jgi:photosystem II stability/assembly factor-like uncharacterized protein
MMQLRISCALLLCVLGGFARAADLRSLEDAPLHAVQFVDALEGWVAGADGVVWHSIDGGKHWERQPTGTRAALRSIHFLNPYTGWAVGREELPHAGGSVGVVLFTDDGGLRWDRMPTPTLPGLNFVRFFDGQTGVVAGDGSDLFPAGVFVTRDAGRSWHTAPGTRCPAWLAGDFRDPDTGVLAGAWGRLATLREGVFNPADVDKLGGRGVRAVRVQGRRAVAVGQGGLVLLSQDSGGDRWGFADLRRPPTQVGRASQPVGLDGLGRPSYTGEGWEGECDFDAVALVDEHIWIAGRPGSVVFHSADFGRTWEPIPTGQPLPLHALHFRDAQNGWAVGELGAILSTNDGGRTWAVQRRGGQRAAVLFVHARPDGAALETIAALGAEDGYLTAAIRVTAADPINADPRHAADAARWTAAQRRAGGAAGDCLAIPLPEHLGDTDRAALAAMWDRSPSTRGEAIVRQITMAIRTWQPEVVVTDFAGAGPETLTVAAVREAFGRAADPKAFPEQIQTFHLEPWTAKKLYGAWEGSGMAPVVVQATEPGRRLGDAFRDFAGPAEALIVDHPTELPARRSFRLLASTVPGAESHGELMSGIALAAGGTARRPLPVDIVDPEREAEVAKAVHVRRNLQALSQPDWGKLSDSGALLAQIAPVLAKLPPEQGATAAFGIASRYADAGQWHLAREAFLLMVDRYPTHPLAADAYRWLARYHSSSEARRREELGQFLMLTQTDIRQASHVPTASDPVTAGARTVDSRDLSEMEQHRELALLSDQAGARKWFQGALEVEPRLTALGALRADDPAVQFCLNSARRHLGDPATPRAWYRKFLAQPRGASKPGEDPWRDAAAAELWLIERNGPPPKPLATCKQVTVKPFLDGDLDDACWKDAAPIVLRDAGGETAALNATRAWLAYDAEYLYVAVRCQHPPGAVVPPVAKRTRDADLRAFDRVSIMLDLDRDYQTYFHLQIDERGALAEDCWGDRTWNPTWFVASKSGPDGWTAEAAIPLKELTGDAPTIGKAWAVNVVRILPGRGVQAMSLPADVRPRPEGMGLLMFNGDPKVKP